jgi:prolyl-tRNA synthetase
MNRAGAIEILMPMVQPRELWDESKRWNIMGKGLLKFKDRNDHEMCLGPTHEEVVTDIARREVKSYRDLPLNLYQIQTKYRDEIRARFGLMRGKEFVMKDAYSFDVDRDSALVSYDAMFKAYKRIFARCGLDFRTVRADSGAIGGSHTHEFQVLAMSGEDQIMACSNCDYASNVEITPALSPLVSENQTPVAMEHFKGLGLKVETLKGHQSIHTPNLKTIADLAVFLKIPAHNLVKTLFYKINDKKFLCILLRGDEEMNEIKLKNLYSLDAPPEMCNEDEVLKITGAHPGSCGPAGLENIAILCDNGLKNLKNWVVGANKDDYHFVGINPDVDFKPTRWADLRKAREGDLCPECKTGVLKSHRGIEVGHVFYLGDKYSKAMKAVYLDETGKSKACEMGCYGIGIGRTVQAAIEQSHDKDGMIWPLPLAPFEVLVALLDVEDGATKEVAEKIYRDLNAKGIEVLLDDRNERPGIKFKDADLIGVPIRINVGKKSLADGNQVEFVERKSKAVTKLKPEAVIEHVIKFIKDQKELFSPRD